jgi:hypothetical protein
MPRSASASRSRSGAGETRSEQHRAHNLLHALSWRVEKLFRQSGNFPCYLWLMEDAGATRTWLKTEWIDAYPGENGDAEALAALRTELRADFSRDGIVRYAVAFPATATVVLRESILHLNGEVVRQQVVCIEAHDGDVHLRAQCEVHDGSLSALAAIEVAPGCFALLC